MVAGTPPEMSPNTKTPEMNELESDKKNLKSGALNFEKQKNESKIYFGGFFYKKNLQIWTTPELEF